MARPLRLEFPGAVYHLTARGNAQQDIFLGAADRDSHLLELARYLVLNPVRAGMLEQAGEWLWGSFRATSNEAPRPPWLGVASLLSQFGQQEPLAIQVYRRFVQEGLG